MRFDAAILVGGAGRRMGGAVKPLLPYDGIPILERQLAVLRPRFDRIVLCTSKPEVFDGYDIPTVPDVVGDTGPMAGLVAALQWATATHLFLVAGDMPKLSGDVIDVFLAQAAKNPDADVICTRIGGRVEPLHAVYRTAAAPGWLNQLRQGQRSPRRIIEEGAGVKVDWVSEELLRQIDAGFEFTHNVNRPAELS